MNNALENYSTFLFFVSKNSLESFMCGLEWKTALILAKENNRSFVPIIIDDTNIPVILLDFKHINLYSDGLEKCKHELVSLLEHSVSKIEERQEQNLYAKASISSNILRIEIGCKFWAEPNSSFCIATGLNERKNIANRDFEGFQGGEEIINLDGADRNCIFIRPFRQLTPNNPFVISFYVDNLTYLLIMHVSGDKGAPIDTTIINSN